MTTKPLLDKVSAGIDLDKDDLALLNTLTQMQEAPEMEPDDKVIHKGDEDNPAPMVRTETKSAGYVYLRRNSDGKLVSINKNQLALRLKQKLDDGRPAWLPPNAPWKGRARVPDKPCLLSAEHPDRERMDALNLEVCPKKGRLMGAAALRRHMIKKHKDAWEAIQRDEDQRRQDARDERDAKMAEALTMAIGGAKPAKQKSESDTVYTETCGVCHVTFEATAKIAAGAKLRGHMKKEHGDGG